jgi:hypothetical protein
MFNAWLALKQMSDALQHGRLDDAYRLGQSATVREHQRGGEVLKQLGLALLERAKSRLAGADVLGGWQDIERAGEVGAEARLVEKFKAEAGQAAMREASARLERGSPQDVCTFIGQCKKLGLCPPGLTAVTEVARAWLDALDLVQRGELNLAVARFESTDWRSRAAAATFRTALIEQQLTFTEKNVELQLAMEQRRWRDVIRLADQILVLAPQCAPVRRARSLAWKELEPTTLVQGQPKAGTRARETAGVVHASAGAVAVLTPPAAAQPELPPSKSLPRRFILWIDGVGGFLVCLSAKVSLGQASEGAVDVPIFADISRLHAYISRDSEGYLLEAIRPVQINGQAVDKKLLKDGDMVSMGTGCQMRFQQPVAITNTARLELKSRHKLPLSLDGIVLMDETILMGDGADAHIVIPGLRRPVALLRRKEELIVQSALPFTVDGQPVKNRGVLWLSSSVAGDDFRLTLEPIGPQFGRVRA